MSGDANLAKCAALWLIAGVAAYSPWRFYADGEMSVKGLTVRRDECPEDFNSCIAGAAIISLFVAGYALKYTLEALS
jgi:hypothetical protein